MFWGEYDLDVFLYIRVQLDALNGFVVWTVNVFTNNGDELFLLIGNVGIDSKFIFDRVDFFDDLWQPDPGRAGILFHRRACSRCT